MPATALRRDGSEGHDGDMGDGLPLGVGENAGHRVNAGAWWGLGLKMRDLGYRGTYTRSRNEWAELARTLHDAAFGHRSR